MSNSHQAQVDVAATYMRGGTSKGVFFKLSDLPELVHSQSVMV